MKKNIYLWLSAALFICCTSKQETQVHLKGQIANLESNEILLSYDGASSLIGNSRDIMLHTNSEGCFDTIITLTEPDYFQLNRNSLYLKPGDDLTMKLTDNCLEAEFSGIGAEENNYLKERPFPQSGSYLEGGNKIRESYIETKNFVDSMATVRRAQLANLTGVSEEFKILEEGRIKADVANCYLCFPIYATVRKRNILTTQEEFNNHIDSLYGVVINDVKPILNELNNDKLLKLSVVRKVMVNAARPDNEISPALSEGIVVSSYMKELYQSENYMRKLSESMSEETVKETEAFIKTMQIPEFASELKIKLENASKLLKGKPAIDFEMTDIDGNVHRLSDFKGKVIYLDFWATWCGPCVQESPFFEKLAKDFAGKDVVFIPVSIDKNKNDWTNFITAHKKELPQYNSLDKKIVSEWNVQYIPRFIIIDKDFNIVNAHAPVPSGTKIVEVLDSLVK